MWSLIIYVRYVIALNIYACSDLDVIEPSIIQFYKICGYFFVGSLTSDGHTVLRWYAQSESIVIKTHSKTIVLQDYRFYLLAFFLSLLLFTVPRCKTIVLKDSRIFLLVFL
jgi:hypothetical protein